MSSLRARRLLHAADPAVATPRPSGGVFTAVNSWVNSCGHAHTTRRGVSHEITILHVDDDPSFAELTATRLERQDDLFGVETVTSADEALAWLADGPPDCIVSDYEMPGTDGIELLRAVREEYSDLPFVLFTGRGSEAVASDAISAGVTDYLQKQSGVEQYELLANRVRNAVTARREARRAARQETLMRLTEAVGDTGGFEIDLETHEITTTEGARRLADLPEDADLDVAEAVELYHPDDRQAVRRDIDRAVETGEQTRGTYRYTPPDADDRLFEITFDPATVDGDTTALRGAIRDVTERRERRHALEQTETLFRHAQDGLFLVDVDEQFTVERVNPALEESMGLTAATACGQTPRQVFGGDADGAGVEARYRECVERRDALQYEEQFDLDEETTHWQTRIAPVVLDDTVEYIVGSTRNVTEQKRRQRELEAEQRFVSQATDAMDDLLYVLDDDGTLCRWNSRVTEVTGYAAAELDGADPLTFFYEPHRERVADALATALTGEDVTVEADLLTAAGERIPYEFTGARLTDEAGRTTGVVGIGRDVTDRRSRERRLQELTD